MDSRPRKIAAVGRVERPAPVFTDTAERGQFIFKKHCLMCHTLFKDGPVRLPQAIDNGHWSDRKELFKWLQDPVSYVKNEPYGKVLFERFGSYCLQPTPRLNRAEMEEVIAYLRYCRGKQSL
ncbi:MAG: c-type cytochrome [Chitinophagaceae bacterium]|nr:c-type cytochrome [Chitinophagaceae bacterium]